MEDFSWGTRVVLGDGAAQVLGTLGARRLFLVTDRGHVQSGDAQRLLQAAGPLQAQAVHQVPAEAAAEPVAQGAARLRAFQADVLVALGSGGVLECARAMALFARGKSLLAVLPTVPGSGAEATDFVTMTQGRARRLLRSPGLRPDLAVLDSRFLEDLPPPDQAEAGFRVLAQAVEGCCAAGAGTITDLLAREAFVRACAALPAACAGRTEARMKLHLASTLAGLCCTQAGLGLCHALAQSLAERFPVALGRLCAILLPAVVRCNAQAAQGKYAALGRAAGMGGIADPAAVEKLRAGLVRLRRELELPQTLAQAGVDPALVWRQADELTQAALDHPWSRTNPVPPEDFLVRRVLEEVTGRM